MPPDESRGRLAEVAAPARAPNKTKMATTTVIFVSFSTIEFRWAAKRTAISTLTEGTFRWVCFGAMGDRKSVV